MKKRSKASLEDIEERALRDEDVLAEFGEPRIRGAASVTRRKIQRVNVDFTDEMLDELDHLARRMNVSRQAVIKMLLRISLDQRAIADQANKHTA